jgi:hypothetical protein
VKLVHQQSKILVIIGRSSDKAHKNVREMTFSYAALAEEFSNFMQCTMFFQFGVVRWVEVQSFQKSLFSDATIAGWIGLCSRM